MEAAPARSRGPGPASSRFETWSRKGDPSVKRFQMSKGAACDGTYGRARARMREGRKGGRRLVLAGQNASCSSARADSPGRAFGARARERATTLRWQPTLLSLPFTASLIDSSIKTSEGDPPTARMYVGLRSGCLAPCACADNLALHSGRRFSQSPPVSSRARPEGRRSPVFEARRPQARLSRPSQHQSGCSD